MSNSNNNRFDEAAANWDAVPQRAELAKAVGQAILRRVQPTPGMDVLDYGCGTGLLGLFLLPHVRGVTGADSSPGMLKVMDDKIRSGGLLRMRTQQLDLERDPIPQSRYHVIAANMVLHHVDRTETLLAAFHECLLPGGAMAIADLDAEPGLFHRPEAAASVYHHGFDRQTLKDCLRRAGFVDTDDETVHVVRKPVATGEMRDFPVFLMVGRRPQDS